MRALLTMLVAGALAAQPAAAIAQAAKPKAAAAAAKPKPAAPAAAKPKTAGPPPSEAELKEATETLSLLVSAFNSKDIPEETKTGLLLCLYANPLGKIAQGQSEALAGDKTIDANSPTQRLLVIAALCRAPLPKPADVKPGEAAPATEPPADQPAPDKGR